MSSPTSLRNGRFVLLSPIGEGAQGRTFDGIDEQRGRAVAIKRFDVRGAASWKDVELAEREARVLQSVSHPKLPAYVDHFEQDGALYLVMDKIEGESLQAVRRRGATLGEDDVWRLLGDASDVLDYLHGRAPPLIHRDLKPGNVIRRADGSFAFVDFGAVRDKLRPRGGSTVVGTFGYMAPEQVQGRALPASDVYAVGATALAMLTGCEPEDLPHRGLAIDVRRALEGRASGRIASVLERMLDPDPDRRASRIAPLLAPGARGVDAREIRHAARRAAREAAEDARRAARRAAHRSRREARRAARAQRRGRGRSGGPPWPLRVAFAILVAAGMVAVTLALKVVVPAVLGVLSLLFARRPLRDAARSVSRAGDAAVDAMRSSARLLRPEGAAASERADPRARVDDGDDDARRIDVDPGEGLDPELDTDASDASDEADDANAHRSIRR